MRSGGARDASGPPPGNGQGGAGALFPGQGVKRITGNGKGLATRSRGIRPRPRYARPLLCFRETACCMFCAPGKNRTTRETGPMRNAPAPLFQPIAHRSQSVMRGIVMSRRLRTPHRWRRIEDEAPRCANPAGPAGGDSPDFASLTTSRFAHMRSLSEHLLQSSTHRIPFACDILCISLRSLSVGIIMKIRKEDVVHIIYPNMGQAPPACFFSITLLTRYNA